MGIYFGLGSRPSGRTSPARVYGINTVYFWASIAGPPDETVARHVQTVRTRTDLAAGVGK
jgi:hypothetical protein